MNKYTKILHLTWSFKIGGKEHLVIDLINGLNKNFKVDLGLINTNCNPYLIDRVNKSINIYCFNRKEKSKNPIFIFYLYKYLIHYKPDIIHFHSSKLFIYLILYKLLFKSKFILTVHGLGEVDIFTKYFDKIIFISESLENSFNKIPTQKRKVIYNGVTISCKKENNIENRINRKIYKICQIGRLNHIDKGQDILINAFKKYINFNNNCRLDLIGDGASIDYLSRIVDELDLCDKVRFLGDKSREYIINNLSNYNLLVQPSRNEGFGLTVVESMLLFTPVLVSSDTGAAEVIENGKYGYIFNNEDELDLTQKIIEVWKNWQKEQIFDKVSKAQKFAEKTYSINNMVYQYEKLYQELKN